MRIFLIDRVIQEEGLYIYNMHNIVKKHFRISIVPCKAWASRQFNNKIDMIKLSLQQNSQLL
jgi:hypothetical protein